MMGRLLESGCEDCCTNMIVKCKRHERVLVNVEGWKSADLEIGTRKVTRKQGIFRNHPSNLQQSSYGCRQGSGTNKFLFKTHRDSILYKNTTVHLYCMSSITVVVSIETACI